MLATIRRPFYTRSQKPRLTGDTIVEVLLAIAIAGFAVAISYGTAQRSLQAAVSAKEHNEALNLLENQISALQVRYNSYQQGLGGASTFQNDFGAGRITNNHYCLDDTVTSSSGPGQWLPYFNASPTPSSPLTTPPYTDNASHTACVRPSGNGFNYYLDIIVSPANSGYKSLFQVIVRWERLGGGQPNQASLYYKVDG